MQPEWGVLSIFLSISTYGNTCYVKYVYHAYIYDFSQETIFLLPFLCHALGNTQGADESVLWHRQNHNESISSGRHREYLNPTGILETLSNFLCSLNTNSCCGLLDE